MKNKLHQIIFATLITSSLSSCAQKENHQIKNQNQTKVMNENNLDTITLAGGCFWCVEAVYEELKGVESVASGYTGGKIANPSYREVCSGLTGHAEVVQITYDKSIVSLSDVLEVFFTVHDPTTLNRQGNDVGTQYRSAIFYHNEEQKKMAEEIIAKLNKSGAYNSPIVTEVTPFTQFYKAEDYHQDYYELNGSEPYCQYVVRPKVEKFKKVFHDKLK